MMDFEIHVPENLSFQAYLAVMQRLRVYADACDKKVCDSSPRCGPYDSELF